MANKGSKIQTKYPNATFLNTTAIYKYVKRFLAASSTRDCKKVHGIPILTKKKLDIIGAGLETSPRKSLAQLAQHTGVTVSSP